MGDLQADMIPPKNEDRWVYKAELVRVIDGDTVVLDISLGCDAKLKRQYCRLLGMDAKEMVGSERAEGMKAKKHLSGLLAQAMPLLIRTKMDATGSFRRLLVWLWDGDVCINRKMISNGFATPREV